MLTSAVQSTLMVCEIIAERVY
uniref:Uncharacterized protein n=1 Tax=Rhizophora mucronata TaxID=61149 RepID=A0A2P2NDB9_RHIMU